MVSTVRVDEYVITSHGYLTESFVPHFEALGILNLRIEFLSKFTDMLRKRSCGSMHKATLEYDRFEKNLRRNTRLERWESVTLPWLFVRLTDPTAAELRNKATGHIHTCTTRFVLQARFVELTKLNNIRGSIEIANRAPLCSEESCVTMI